MEFKNQKDLIKFITLLRKNGVQSIKIGALELSLKPSETRSYYKRKKDEKDEISTPTYTEDELLLWSTQMEPEVAQ